LKLNEGYVIYASKNIEQLAVEMLRQYQPILSKQKILACASPTHRLFLWVKVEINLPLNSLITYEFGNYTKIICY